MIVTNWSEPLHQKAQTFTKNKQVFVIRMLSFPSILKDDGILRRTVFFHEFLKISVI